MARSFGCRSMTYSLLFHEKALPEWRKLDRAVRERLKAKLAERMENPHVPGDRLSGPPNRYKIKLMNPGVRLVYEVVDDRVEVYVLAIGKRERDQAYVKAAKRIVER